MSLKDWLDEGRIKPHESSQKEITDLLKIVDRDLADAKVGSVSADRRFATAYNAVLRLATIVIRASGYRISGSQHHWITFQVLPELMSGLETKRWEYFDASRRLRNKVDYDTAFFVSESQVRELVKTAEEFRTDVLEWLKNQYPDLYPAKT